MPSLSKSLLSLPFHNVSHYGAVGDDVTNNAPAVAAARAVAGIHRPISLFLGDYNSSLTTSPYGSVFKDALGHQELLGTAASPATRHEPLWWVEKISASDRALNPLAWDQGAIYASLEKVSGDAFGTALTAFTKYTGGSGDMVALHARAKSDVSGARIFGGWFYAHNTHDTPDRVVGAEIDMDHDGADHGWESDATAGSLTGLIVATVSGKTTHGIRFTKHTGEGFWTAIQVAQDAVPGNTITAAISDGEAIHIRGGSSTSLRIGGIRLGTGHFRYGISTSEATLGNNCAILLADTHRISWGSTPASGRHLTTTSVADPTLNYTGGSLNLATGTAEYRIAGTKVLDARETGWTAMAGTATKGGFDTATVTLPQLAQVVKALVDKDIYHGNIGA